MMMWASAQWSNEGLLKMISGKIQTLIWNSKIWLAAEGAWDDDVSKPTVVQCNEGLLKMIDEKVLTLIWNCTIWLAAEGEWDNNVSQCTVVQ